MTAHATLKIGKETYEVLDSGGFVLMKGIIDKRTYIWDVTQAMNQVSRKGWSVKFLLEKNSSYHYYLITKEG